MRKHVWLWVIVAFLVGLAPGAATSWWLWRNAGEARTELVERNAELSAENKALEVRVNSAEASVSALTTRLEQARLGATVSSPSAAGTATAAAGTGGAPNITERAVSPQKTSPGGKITLTVKLTGRAERVDMRIVSKTPGFDKIYYLAKISSDGGETWEKVIEAPGAPGEYRYYAIAWSGGKKYTMPGASGWSFLVE